MAGRYESWFLSARDAEPGHPPRAIWIRHTRHRAVDAETGSAALWCTVFDPAGGAPAAVKESVAEFPANAGAGPDGFRGGARARGRMAEWELTLSGGGAPLKHLRPGALYRLPLPKTKLEAPVPDGIASGRVVLDGALVDVVGWRATVGHNWGREHAERWVWLHAAGFADEPEAWLELAIARVRIGGALTPWIANGAVSVGGRRFRLGGLGHIPGVRVVAAPGRLEASCPASGSRSGSPSTPISTRPSASSTRASAPTRSTASARCCTPGWPRCTSASAGPAADRRSWPRRRAAPTSSAAATFTHRVPLQPYPDP